MKLKVTASMNPPAGLRGGLMVNLNSVLMVNGRGSIYCYNAENHWQRIVGCYK